MFVTILRLIKFFNNFGIWCLNGPRHLFLSFCCNTWHILEPLRVFEPRFNTDKYGMYVCNTYVHIHVVFTYVHTYIHIYTPTKNYLWILKYQIKINLFTISYHFWSCTGKNNSPRFIHSILWEKQSTHNHIIITCYYITVIKSV